MKHSVCPDRQTLGSLLLGRLPADRAELLEAHLLHCDDCSRAAETIKGADELTAAFASDVPLNSDEDEAALVAAIERARQIRTLSETVSGADETDPSIAVNRSGRELEVLAPPEQPDEIGRLGTYRVLEVLGAGGMGVVFRAEDPKLNRHVALKAMKPEIAAEQAARTRFLREAQAAAAIEDDNIVPIYQVGEDRGLPFIAMPFLRGESLKDRLQRQPRLEERELLRIARDVASALTAAHKQGLIHRDIKPDNIWLDETTGRAKVLDFGLARTAGEETGLTQSGVVLGTPRYMSPEQAQGEAIDHRCDLFSLGSVLYHMATGESPFQGANLTATLLAVAERDPEPIESLRPDMTPELSSLIRRLLAKAPVERPQTAGEVVQALSEIEDNLCSGQSLATSASPSDGTTEFPAPGQSLATSATRWRTPAYIATATICLAGIGLLIWAGVGRIANPSYAPESSPAKTDALNDSRRNADTGGPQAQPHYRGRIDVLVERKIEGKPRLLRLDDPAALPLRRSDKFRIEGAVDPHAYLYVVWVDPNHDVTPIYPWDPTKGWNSRPRSEQRVGRISLPENKANRYTAPDAMPGVATMVLFATSKPLDVSDEAVKRWFEQLPELPLPPGGDRAAVWFDDFVEVREPSRLRTFKIVEATDRFAQWQGRLQKLLGGRVEFQTAVSFARTGRK